MVPYQNKHNAIAQPVQSPTKSSSIAEEGVSCDMLSLCHIFSGDYGRHASSHNPNYYHKEVEAQLGDDSTISTHTDIITVSSTPSFDDEDRIIYSKVRINSKLKIFPTTEISWPYPNNEDLWYTDEDYDEFEERYNYQMKKVAARIGKSIAPPLKKKLAKRHGSPRRVPRLQQ